VWSRRMACVTAAADTSGGSSTLSRDKAPTLQNAHGELWRGTAYGTANWFDTVPTVVLDGQSAGLYTGFKVTPCFHASTSMLLFVDVRCSDISVAAIFMILAARDSKHDTDSSPVIG